MRTFNNSKDRPAICFEFGDLFFTSPTKLELEEKASFSSTTKEILPFYRRKLLVFVMLP